MRLATPLVALLLWATPAAAQEDPTARRAGTVDVPMLERSRIYRNVPNAKTKEIYEGLIALHFPFTGNMQDGYDRAAATQKSSWTFLPSASMIVNLRQTVEESAPVRTPSYMPRVRLTAVRTGSPMKIVGSTDQRSTQWVFDGTFGHYSNGQDGCLFVGQSGPKCTFATPVADADLVVNRKDGSFSSHYLEGGVARRWLKWKEDFLFNTRLPSKSITTAFVRVRDYKLLSGLGGGMEPDLRRLYSSLRIRAGFEHSVETESPRGPWWTGGWLEYSNSHAPGNVTQWRGALEGGKTFDRLGGTGVFIRWYAGHDDYNLGFLQRINVVQVGIALGGERRPTFMPRIGL